MLMEKSKWKPHEDESTDAEYRDGTACSSDEAFRKKRRAKELCYPVLKTSQPIMGGTYGQNKAA